MLTEYVAAHRKLPWHTKKARHSQRRIEQMVLRPDAPLAEAEAVISGEESDCAVGEAMRARESSQHVAQLLIKMVDCRGVRYAERSTDGR